MWLDLNPPRKALWLELSVFLIVHFWLSRSTTNHFLYCLLRIAVATTFGFQMDQIEKNFLRAN
jgi:hypothetical protein